MPMNEKMCAVCGEVITNPVGRQKYHARCRDALFKRRKKGVTEEEKLAEARQEIKAIRELREAKLNYLKEHCDPNCPCLTNAGDNKRFCLLPVCRGKGFWG